jgi:hypothetical protein
VVDLPRSARLLEVATRALSRLDVLLAESATSGELARAARLPAGWRAENYLGLDRRDDFLPLEDAAVAMGLEPATVVGLVQAGGLDARVGRDGLLVRPAVVSILGVRDPRVASEQPRQPEPAPSSREPEPARPMMIDDFGRETER